MPGRLALVARTRHAVRVTEPYRQLVDVPEEPPDLELECARVIHRRAELVRKVSVVTLLLSGMALGAVGYTIVRDLFFARFGAHNPYLTASIAMTGPMVLAFRLARVVSDAVVRARVDAWADDLAARHGVSREALAEHVRVARGDDLGVA